MRILTTALTAVFLCLNAAHAETYVRGVGGTGFDWKYEHNDFTLKTRNGYFAGGAIGTELGEAGPLSFAVEGEFTYQRSPVDNLDIDSDLSTIGVFANGLVRFDSKGQRGFRPYFGGGLGLAVNSFQVEGIDRRSTADPGLAWQAIGGLNIRVTRHISLDLQYRYTGQDLLSVGDKINNDHFNGARQHVALAGITVCLSKCWKYW